MAYTHIKKKSLKNSNVLRNKTSITKKNQPTKQIKTQYILLGMVACTFSPSTQKVEAADPREFKVITDSSHSKLQDSKDNIETLSQKSQNKQTRYK